MNPEVLSKLNEQLAQRDNMIKLLKLRLQNMEDGDAPVAAGQPPAAPESVVPARRADAERVRELEERLANLRHEVETREAATRMAEKRAGDLQRALDEVGKKTTTQDEEIKEARSEFNQLKVHTERLGTELSQARSRTATLEGELSGLRKELESRPEATPSGSDPILQKELEQTRRELRVARKEAESLQAQLVETEKSETASRTVQDDRLTAGVLNELMTLLTQSESLRRRIPQDLHDSWGNFEALICDVAAKLGIRRIRAVGESYNPDIHQVVKRGISLNHPHDTVVRELTPGFISDDGVVRLAEVEVSINPNHCTKCDKTLPEGSSFCNFCGSKLPGDTGEEYEDLDTTGLIDSQLELARKFEDKGNHQKAVLHYKNALNLDPNSNSARSGLARVYEMEGRYDLALEHLEALKEEATNLREVTRQEQRIQVKKDIMENMKRLLPMV